MYRTGALYQRYQMKILVKFIFHMKRNLKKSAQWLKKVFI